MKKKLYFGLVAATATLAVSPLLAAPADQVRARVNAYKALGAAYKVIADATRSGQTQTQQVRLAAAQISQMARQQYALFPNGSGPRPGVQTDAKLDIWSRAREFRAAQDGFAQQSAALQRAVNGGDAASIRTEARKLGGTCKSCHDTFRAGD